MKHKLFRSQDCVGPAVVVNADDYGYFRCVSKGIRECIDSGTVTATGIMANGDRFAKEIADLREYGDLDRGVHLNITYGTPLCPSSLGRLTDKKGQFWAAPILAALIISGRVERDIVRAEWSAQIERCRNHGLAIRFLNCHEHVQILPGLKEIMDELAQAYAIPFVRRLDANWRGTHTLSGVVRNSLFSLRRQSSNERLDLPALLGVGFSGKASYGILRKVFAALNPNQVYELMCHPGRCDISEINDSKLLRYHSWDQERALFAGGTFAQLCKEFSVRLIRFSDLLPAAAVR